MWIHGASDTAAFNSIVSPIKNRAQKTLENEELEEESQRAQDKQWLQDFQKLQNLRKSSSNEVVIFDDAVSGGRFAVFMSKDNLQRLREKFDSSDFYTRKNGEIRLNGQAEAYVSGWFGEIAYNMGALKADKDKNGKFSDDEKSQIKSDIYLSFRTENSDSVVYDFKVEQYKNSNNLKYENIDEMLDSIISKDKNLDGVVSLVEHLGNQKLYQTIAEMIKSCECKGDDKVDVEKLIQKLEKNKDEISKDEAVQLLHKIRQNGNIESLTIKEQEALRKYFASEMERIKREDSKSEQESFNQVINHFVEQIYSSQSLILNLKA